MSQRIVTILAILLVCHGCGREEPRVWHVDGLLTVNGSPAPNACIALHRPDEPSAACPVGITGPDGTFQLTTFAPNDGAPPGDYVVTLIWHDASKPVDECECVDSLLHDLLRGLYADATTSELRATVGRERTRLRLDAEAPLPAINDPQSGVGSIFSR